MFLISGELHRTRVEKGSGRIGYGVDCLAGSTRERSGVWLTIKGCSSRSLAVGLQITTNNNNKNNNNNDKIDNIIDYD